MLWVWCSRGFFLGNCELVNNMGQQQHKHKAEVSILLDVNGSPADVIFHLLSQCKPSQFSSNWFVFTGVPGAPSLCNWLISHSSYSPCNKNEAQSLKTKMLWCTLNALHLENSLHDNAVQLDERLPFHLKTNGNRRIMQRFLQPERALYRSLIVFRCLYNCGPRHKVTKEVQAAPYNGLMHQLYVQRELLAGECLEQSIVVLFSALVWVSCLLMISQAKPGVVCMS